MGQIYALPTLTVEIAFSPTNLYTTSQTWTNVTQYVRDFQTRSGRQHFLSRIESSTLAMTLDNRSGYFSSGSTILGTRMPIRVTAVWNPTGSTPTPYPIYYGIIDTVAEMITDVLNLDLSVQASDLTKYMSLREINSPQFWSGYCKPPSMGGTATSAIHWYDCNANKQANVVAAVATTTAVTYYYAPGTAVVFAVSDKVTITGLTPVTTGAAYNLTNVTIASIGTGYFTVTYSSAGGKSIGQATATKTFMTDLIGSATGEIIDYASFTNNGAMVYEVNSGIDLASGSNYNNQASIKIPYNGANITNVGGIDFWMNGAGTAISTNIMYLGSTSTPKYFGIYVNPTGQIEMAGGGFAGIHDYTVATGPVVNDGYWHHIGIVCNEAGYVNLYCDGVFYNLPTPILGPLQTYNSGTAFTIGYQVAAYFDEIVINSNASLSTLAKEVQQRWMAGSLLQLGFPTTSRPYSSGTRIAEILCISGFGLITGGSSTAESVMTLSCGYYINDSPTPWVRYAAGNGYTYTEPYYWDSPVTGSTALDLILQVCDTDIGIFYQEPNGTFSYYNQLYYGYWSWTSSTTSLTVGTGMKTLIIPAGIPFTPGSSVTLTNQLSLMTGTVITYASGPGSNYTLIVNITNSNGTGTQSLWNVGSWALNNTYTPAPNANHTWTDTGTNVPYFAPTLQIVRDDVDVWTTVKVTPQSGTEQIFENTISENRWGYTTLTKSGTLHTSLNSALSTATYLGNLFQSPLPRVQNVELRAESYNGTYIPAILGSEIGDIVNFQRNPSGASADGSINSNFVIESISHEFQADPGTWHTSYILDPYPL